MISEIDKSDRETIGKYHGLSRIEDSFRITVSDLEGRPVYLGNKAKPPWIRTAGNQGIRPQPKSLRPPYRLFHFRYNLEYRTTHR